MNPDQGTKAIDTIQQEIKGIEESLMPLLQTQAEEIKRHGETATNTSKAIKDLEAKYDERLKDLDGVRQSLDELKTEFGEAQLPTSGKARAQTPGQLFIDSSEFKDRARNIEHVPAVEVKSFFGESKALFTGASIGSVDTYLGSTIRQPGIVQEPAPDMHIRDLLNVTQT